MTPGAWIAAAIEVLSDLQSQHRPASAALRDWGLSHRFAGSRDRAVIGNIVYDALRRRRSIAFQMEDDAPRASALGVVGLVWGWDVTLLLKTPHAPAPPSGSEARLLEESRSREFSPAVEANVPDWIAPSLARGFGESEWVAEMHQMAARPPLDIRVNRLKADRAKVARGLKRLGPKETAFAPDGLRFAPTMADGRHPNLQSEPSFQKGWFEVQDEGSQIAGLSVGPERGSQVLDLCAGGGGKTLALAAAMGNRGQVHASDRDPHRLAPIYDRLRRGGTRNVQVHPAGESLDGLIGQMDRVLVDAPCTGSGTWRRHPDSKWRLSDRNLKERIAAQVGLLKQATTFVRPGGLLAYVTCSLLPEENEEQVSRFQSETKGFELLSPGEIVASVGLDPSAANRLLEATRRDAPGLLLTPRRTQTDGFFIALFRRAT